LSRRCAVVSRVASRGGSIESSVRVDPGQVISVNSLMPLVPSGVNQSQPGDAVIHTKWEVGDASLSSAVDILYINWKPEQNMSDLRVIFCLVVNAMQTNKTQTCVVNLVYDTSLMTFQLNEMK